MPFSGDSSWSEEGRVLDGELGDDGFGSLIAADAVKLARAERGDIEVDRLAAPAHGQLGDDAGHRSSASPGAWRT
jgi:hypothetical protein